MAITRYDDIPEGSTKQLVIQLLDETGAANVAKTNLTTVTITLISLHSGNIINSRSAQSILDANGGSVSTGGTLTLTLGILDNIIENDALPIESHHALIIWTYASGAKAGKKEIALLVKNLAVDTGVPAIVSGGYSVEGLTIPAGYTFTITHNLNNIDAKLISFQPYWGPTAYKIISKTASTIVLSFSVPSPGSFADVVVV